MLQSVVYVDECLQADMRVRDIAWLSLEFERLFKWALEHKIYVSNSNGGLELRAMQSFSRTTMARIANHSHPLTDGIPATRILCNAHQSVTKEERMSFEEAYCLHRDLVHAESSALFDWEDAPTLEYRDPLIQAAWDAWLFGMWWMWCLLNPKVEPSGEEIGASLLEVPEQNATPGPSDEIKISAVSPDADDDILPWKRPFPG